jgi:hypothetical protein
MGSTEINEKIINHFHILSGRHLFLDSNIIFYHEMVIMKVSISQMRTVHHEYMA